MSALFTLDIVKPDGEVLSAEVEEVTVPGLHGSFGILPDHAPFLTQIGQGAVSYRVGGRARRIMVEGGFCEVSAGRVTILAERAERPGDIDVARATRAKDRAREHLTSIEMSASEEEISDVRRGLERAELRIEIAGDASDTRH